ncbi:FAD/NAD(P)-binding protein [Streptomyces sp. NPDC048717]|uniref:FAD/NAD(P)-binding protein n=1 Tax=Streptomyces sp. NPDC048717 TaxID=3154928 RepID=UPI003415E264
MLTSLNRPLHLAVIGSGPRGLSVLERLVCRLTDEYDQAARQGGPAPRPVVVHLVDNTEIGAGRVWRTDQDPWFTMNTVASQITMYSGDGDQGPARPGAGPSLHEWLVAQTPAGEEPAGPNDYATRAEYGRYLADVYRSVVRALPPHATLDAHRAGVTAVEPRPDGTYRLTLDAEPHQLTCDRVVLATGHPRNEADPFDAAMESFAGRHPVHYLRGDSAADMPLDEATIPAGSTVAIRGLGLSFYDVMLSLTVGRGGEFKAAADGTYTYIPSGREPRIVAGSRSGLPIPARGRNQKSATHSHKPMFLTRAALTATRAARTARTGSAQLDFGADVLPLLLDEIAYVYYTTAHRAQAGVDGGTGVGTETGAGSGAGAADRFARDLADHLHRGQDPAALLASAGLADLPPIDLKALARPFADMRFDGTDAFRTHLLTVMRDDLDQARLGNADGPLKAALDVLRDIRNVVRDAVDFGGLLPASHAEHFERDYLPMNALLSAGPPLERVEQLYALIDQGVVDIVGPHTRFATDETTGTFTVASEQVPGSFAEATALIDARIPTPDLARDTSPLVRRLLADRLVRTFTIQGPDGVHATGGLDVTPAPFRVLDAEGRPHHGLFALGIPTEHTRWFTQVGSSRPGTGQTLFYRDADTIAEALLTSTDATTDATTGVRTDGEAGDTAAADRPLAAAGTARSTS